MVKSGRRNQGVLSIRVSYFPGFTTLEILQQIENDLQCQNVESEQFPDRTKFMSRFNDIEWEKRNIGEICVSNPGVLSSGRLSGY